MHIFNGAILGLGLFFLGLQLTGQNMRLLTGGGFRQLLRWGTGGPWSSGLCGLVAGALMQSATALTFILVSMVSSGLVQSASARVVLIWCNVGLTALAFLAAFNIHPLVAFAVGLSGIAMGSVRRKPWNTIAGAVLGVGIILFEAAPAIYGTNLGAIALRALLARGLSGSSIRLVRMEDFFCIFSGLLMMGLLLLERTGIPLVVAFANHLHAENAMRLAAVFFLSNLIPALILSPLLPICERMLKQFWPSDAAERPGQPKFLQTRALADPETALDLIPKELARLLGGLNLLGSGATTDADAQEASAFEQLGTAVESFCVRLVSENSLSQNQSLRLQRYRAWLHTIRHIGEAAGELKASRNAVPPVAESCANGLLKWMQANILLGAEAASSMDFQKIHFFFESSKQKVASVRALRNAFLESCEAFSPVEKLEMSSLVDNFDIIAWLIHRLSKLQMMTLQSPSGTLPH